MSRTKQIEVYSTKLGVDEDVLAFAFGVDGNEDWLRLEKETDEAWRAFEMYRNLGVGRHPWVVADAGQYDRQQVNKWRHNNRWDERVREFDKDYDRARSVLMRVKLNDARASFVSDMLDILPKSMNLLRERVEDGKVQPQVLVTMISQFMDLLNDENERIGLEPTLEEDKLEKAKREFAGLLGGKRKRLKAVSEGIEHGEASDSG